MSRLMRFKWIALMIFTMGWASTGYAQLPSGCNSADQNRYANFTVAAVQALVNKGDPERFIALMRESETGLSKACQAALNRDQPTRVRCTAKEHTTILQHYQAMISNTLAGNAQQFFVLMAHMEESVSPTCWLAVNQPNDPGVRRNCSSSELDGIASFTGPMIRASLSAATTGDVSPLVNLMQLQEQIQNERLSPRCRSVLAQAAQHQAQQQAQISQNKGTPIPLPGVNDHGGGVLSVPGVGACTPSGCMAF